MELGLELRESVSRTWATCTLLHATSPGSQMFKNKTPKYFLPLSLATALCLFHRQISWKSCLSKYHLHFLTSSSIAPTTETTQAPTTPGFRFPSLFLYGTWCLWPLLFIALLLLVSHGFSPIALRPPLGYFCQLVFRLQLSCSSFISSCSSGFQVCPSLLAPPHPHGLVHLFSVLPLYKLCADHSQTYALAQTLSSSSILEIAGWTLGSLIV